MEKSVFLLLLIMTFKLLNYQNSTGLTTLLLKFGYSEKATKFDKIFHLKFDGTQ